MKPPQWRVTASSYVIDTPFLRLRSDRVELPDGTVVEDYFVRESRGFAVIFATTPDERVILVRQYKHGIGTVVLELPAGAIDCDESAEDCALRELAEETGYVAKSAEYLGSFVTDATSSNSMAHLFLARDARKTRAQKLDVTEKIDVELVTIDELVERVRSGQINGMPHVGSIYTVLDRIGKLTIRP
jgi:8-oxo-dGTP pyrophosphatase MutT (NUDIX family)